MEEQGRCRNASKLACSLAVGQLPGVLRAATSSEQWHVQRGNSQLHRLLVFCLPHLLTATVLDTECTRMQTSTFRSLKRAPGEPVPKAPKRLTNSKATPHDEVENDPIYDAVRMEAASDARAQAAERALTDDERAERERVRVQELEASRKLAAKTDNAGNSDAAEAAAALVAARAMGGYAGRRQVARLEVNPHSFCYYATAALLS